MAAIPQNLGVPTGTVMWSASQEVPVGWLLCDGRSVAVASYPELYAHIGNTYGGDGVVFGLPNLVGRFILGVGDPGRGAFTYEDGINKEHLHGMYPNQTHFHTITDPGHEHPTSAGSHSHGATSSHSHTSTSLHGHNNPNMRTHTYLLISNCANEVYAPPERCVREPDNFFITELVPNNENPAYRGKTGITIVNANVTGVGTQVAFTNVQLATQVTDITLQPAFSNMTAENVGSVGGPRPVNIAFLPIIRT